MLSVFMRLGKNLVKGKIKHNSSQHNLFKSGTQETGIWSHLLKKSLMKNFIFCGVLIDVETTSCVY